MSNRCTELAERFGSPIKFLKSYNPDMQANLCAVGNEDKILCGMAPRLCEVIEVFGMKTAESWLEIQLNNLSEFAGCRDKLTAAEIHELARILIPRYKGYKVTELMLFFRRSKEGEYGHFYGMIDCMVISEWLRYFDHWRSQRLKELEQERQASEIIQREREESQRRTRYKERVPGAYTDAAAVSYLQYSLAGFDSLPDHELQAELQNISRGAKTIPTNALEIIDWLKTKR